MSGISVQGEGEGHSSESPVRKKAKEKKRKKSKTGVPHEPVRQGKGHEKRKDSIEGKCQSTSHDSGDQSAAPVICHTLAIYARGYWGM